MYAQNSILCQFGNSEICPNFANPYLTQFSSISGGNCIIICSNKVKEYVKQRRCLTSHNQQLYAILWGQSSESIHSKVEAHPGCDDIRMESDGIHFLNEIQLIMLNVQEQRYLPLSIHQTKYNFYHLSQGKQTLEQYFQRFNTLRRILEQTQSTLWNDLGLVQEWLTTIAIDAIAPTTL